MSMMKTMVARSAAVAAIAAAAPASAQYYSQQPYYGQSYGYSQPYGYNQYGYNQYNRNGYNQYGYAQPYAVNTGYATQQCTAAVQSRLYNRTSLASILGSLVGLPTNSYGRVLSVTRVTPRGNGMVRVQGLASSGRYAYNGYGRYGEGAYGALGYGYNNAADLSFHCDVAPNGAIEDVHINRR